MVSPSSSWEQIGMYFYFYFFFASYGLCSASDYTSKQNAGNVAHLLYLSGCKTFHKSHLNSSDCRSTLTLPPLRELRPRHWTCYENTAGLHSIRRKTPRCVPLTKSDVLIVNIRQG